MTDPRQRLTLDDFDYALPPALIAQQPAEERTGSRLLRLSAAGLADHRFSDLPTLLAPADLLVLNDTRVIKARLLGTKDSGGRVEVLVERVLGTHEALAQIKASKPPRAGTRLQLAGALDATVLGRDDDLYRLRFDCPDPVLAALERHGSVPLPPYIDHVPADEDAARYQTVFAQAAGAVAAPTAGLHFDAQLLDTLRAGGVRLAFVTLHVGAGTFQPVRVREIADHRMHSERYEIPPKTAAAVAQARRRGGKVVAVGTTSLRALEAAAAQDGSVAAGSAETDLFIVPGYAFRIVDRLITNFHLPKSTLLMLVSAFAGLERVRDAYRHAIERRYRFFSYGDAMLVDRIDG